MGMEYSLRRQLGVSSCGWVERVLDWETYEFGSIPEGVTFGNFFFNLPPKTGQSRLAWLVFFF